jgi:hypothetical protein
MLGFISFNNAKNHKKTEDPQPDSWKNLEEVLKSDGKRISIQEILMEAGKDCEKKGYEDAKVKVSKSTGLFSIHSKMGVIEREVLSRVGEEISKTEEEIALNKENRDKLEKKKYEPYYDEDLGFSNENLIALNYFWGGLFFFAAFIMLITDIPLALKIGNENFDLTGRGDINTFFQGIDLYLYAAGLIFSTLFFKFYYQIYILKSSRNIINGRTYVFNDEEKKGKDKIVWYYLSRSIKFVFNTSILIAIALNFIGTGFIRMAQYFEYYFLEDPIEQQSERVQDFVEWVEYVGVYSNQVFVLASLLYPILGGIYLAIANRKFKEAQYQVKLRQHVRADQKEVKNLESKLPALEARRSGLSYIKTWINGEKSNHFTEEGAAYLATRYNSGYEKGLAELHDPENDMVSVMKTFRSNIAANNITKSFKNEN